MKILVCAGRDIIGCIALNWLVPALRQHELAVLFSCKRRSGYGAPMELEILETLESELPEKLYFPALEAAGFARQRRHLTFSELQKRWDLPYVIVKGLDTWEATAFLEEMSPDLILSLRFSYIFNRALIARVPRGVFNVHPGTLPRYSGIFPVFWQILEKKTLLGCTVHRVDSGVDTGNVFAIDRLPLVPGRSMIWHNALLYRSGVQRLAEIVALLDAGREPECRPQERSERTYFSLPSSRDFATFRSFGHLLYSAQDYAELMTLHVSASGLSGSH